MARINRNQPHGPISELFNGRGEGESIDTSNGLILLSMARPVYNFTAAAVSDQYIRHDANTLFATAGIQDGKGSNVRT